MAARTFEDSTGAVWDVFEVHRASTQAVAVSAGLEKGWLAFVNGSTKRRLAPFPPDWANATPLELERLCAAARLASQPRMAGPAPHSRPRIKKSGRAGTGETAGLASTAPAPAGREREGVMIPDAGTDSVAGSGDGKAVEDTVRAFAHQARTLGLPAIQAMLRLKALLLTNHPAPESEARNMRLVRRWFVEAYYFERNA